MSFFDISGFEPVASLLIRAAFWWNWSFFLVVEWSCISSSVFAAGFTVLAFIMSFLSLASSSLVFVSFGFDDYFICLSLSLCIIRCWKGFGADGVSELGPSSLKISKVGLLMGCSMKSSLKFMVSGWTGWFTGIRFYAWLLWAVWSKSSIWFSSSFYAFWVWKGFMIFCFCYKYWFVLCPPANYAWFCVWNGFIKCPLWILWFYKSLFWSESCLISPKNSSAKLSDIPVLWFILKVPSIFEGKFWVYCWLFSAFCSTCCPRVSCWWFCWISSSFSSSESLST